MEQIPSTRTAEHIDREIAEIDRQILDLDERLTKHSETGSNSPDDEAQEAAQDIQDIATGPGYKMEQLRHKRAELLAERESLNS